ncbi:type 1 glutamine amidotransferase domain-containing protein [Azospirillum griseum]|uniref:Type 1 glutamine amidotransferase domain-containing protein n=1 Tax=Azospirillum griseum TaxID=2496639 RepID=A0A3S0HWD7_9PROT|nr:type 1 glutamine amidotransferase domain-containing protein [Azospirillum griseum]RTR13037.1 type 1 glutamine amidotransferase domain-containing protein [Azospirillum griseum]
MSSKILIVLTGVEKYPSMDRATGVWLGEAVHFVEPVEKAGFTVDYVSPRGGYTPIDPHSLAMASPVDWEWYQNKAFMNRLGATLKPSEVNADEYAAVYYVGGHGVMWDFPDNEELQAISRRVYERGGVVSGVCHGVVGLLNIRLSNGDLLIAGKRVTGFSNEEEKLAQLDQHVPFLTEDTLTARGAVYEKASQPWDSFAVADQRVVTGQNPASGRAVADLVIAQLGR